MEPCPACDTHRPAARTFIHWHRDLDRDPTAAATALRGLATCDDAAATTFGALLPTSPTRAARPDCGHA
ncbi:hypothetical protein [Streptomyces yerevanensis]|uniref:hypothetical protein n=1 Tax=Streptomyces yerevanensis TaxID=66378 RepID=UPI0005244225|nr:hypothetical protein [Streptomyces yerevanensis]